MLTLTERPETWSFSRNFIRYKFNSTVPPLELQLRVYVAPFAANTAGNYQLATLVALAPDAAGNTEFYIEEFVDTFLSWELPAAGMVTAVHAQICSYYIEYREIFTVGSSPAWIQDGACLALKGGLPLQLFNRSVPTQFSQFSYQSGQVLRVGLTDHFYKTFVTFAAPQTLYREAILTVTFSDNTTQAQTISFPNYDDNIYQVPASPAAAGMVLNAGSIPVSYQVKVNTQLSSGNTSLLLVDAVFDHNWYREVTCLQYHNSLGGLDYIRITGDYDVETERSYSDGERIQGADYNLPSRPGQYTQRNLSLSRVQKGDVGYLISPDEQDTLQELDLTESAWILGKIDPTLNQWIQVRILNKTRKMRSRSSKRWNWEVEFQPAFDIKAFSNLPYPGLGIDTNVYVPAVCGIVSNLNATETPTTGGNAFVLFTWTAGQNGWHYELRYRTQGTTAWTNVTAITTTQLILTLPVGQRVEWEVRTQCGPTSFSAWSATQLIWLI